MSILTPIHATREAVRFISYSSNKRATRIRIQGFHEPPSPPLPCPMGARVEERVKNNLALDPSTTK